MNGIFTPPEVVEPLGTSGAIGHGIALLIGVAILVATSLFTRERLEFLAIAGTVLGTIPLGLAEYRFFRAMDPANTLGTALLWIAALGVPVIAAITIAVLFDAGVVGPGLLAAGGILAGLAAGGGDLVQQRLASVPVALPTLIVLSVLGAGYFLLKDRQ